MEVHSSRGCEAGLHSNPTQGGLTAGMVGALLGTVHRCQPHPGTEGNALGLLNILLRQSSPGDRRGFFVVMEAVVGGTKYPRCTPAPGSGQERREHRHSLLRRSSQLSSNNMSAPIHAVAPKERANGLDTVPVQQAANLTLQPTHR
ncbi:uncharacterized protein LOC144100490 [Amblyomma americanum]